MSAEATEGHGEGAEGVERRSANSQGFRAQMFVRGFRRRMANVAWAIGGPVLVGLCLTSVTEDPWALPNWLGYLMIAMSLVSLLTAAISAGVFRYRERERWFDGLEAAGDGGLTLVSAAGDQRVTNIQSAMFFKEKGWLLLSNADLVELTYAHASGAKAAASLLPAALRTAPLVLVPRPSRAGDPLSLFLAGLIFLGIAEEFLNLPFVAGFAALSLAMVGMAFWLRGRRLVVAIDGVRVGSRFYPLDELTRFECTKSTVVWTHAGKKRSAKVRLTDDLAFALQERANKLMTADVPADAALERHKDEEVHAWLRRVAALVRGQDFRELAVSKARALAAAQGNRPLRVRVAAIAALKDEAPELIDALVRDSADPRLAPALKVVGEEVEWQRAIDALERRGELDAAEPER